MNVNKSLQMFIVIILILVLALTACTPSTPVVKPTQKPMDSPTPEPPPPTEALPDNIHKITILYTNDEHGYMEGSVEGLGAAELVGLWQREFGYAPDGPFLVLSGGDMWTGPAISTWFEGASMVQVMNAMGYHAAVAGNHEFDFGLETLSTNIDEMDFPILGANVRYKSNGEIPTDIGIQPYALVEVDEVTFGIIGLAYEGTPIVTRPSVVAPFDFIDYEDALREIVPDVRAAGANLIVVPTHVCSADVSALAAAVADLDIVMFGGGHCHGPFALTTGDAVLLGGGGHLESFAYAQITYSDETGDVTIDDYGMMQNRAGTPDPTVAEIIDEWAAEAEIILNQEIGYVGHTLRRDSPELNQFIAETWLWRFPMADVALTNTGGIRDDIPEGPITVGAVITAMPFDNTIVQIEITGEQLVNTLNSREDAAYAGVKNISGRWVLTATDEEIDPDATYTVLVNSFIYEGGSEYNIGDYDPDGYDTSVPTRQPTLDWIEAQGSSMVNPIDDEIDALIGAEIILNQEIGYVGHTLRRDSRELNQFITETWLWRFPMADVALTNTGGIRDDIPEGPITVGAVITVMPFDNTIVQIEITGEQLVNTLNSREDAAYVGVKNISGRWVLTATDEEIDPDATYTVLVNSFIYEGGDGYRIGDYDPDGHDTSVLYRQPTLDWIEAQGSSMVNPIDDEIDALIGGE